tara:strand:+ start:346 stop:3840 length:3495 start_codon:yes stop_codon:yes gene_type:complete
MDILNDIPEYIKYAIHNNDAELEILYGGMNIKNINGKIENKRLNKETFSKILNHCKSNLPFEGEIFDLDIREEVLYRSRSNISNIRTTIPGIHNIQKYCVTNELHEPKYLLKENIKELPKLVNEDYYYKVNLKRETELLSTNEKIVSMLKEFNNKNKHYRYKKRYSFITIDNLFRIDLTIVKSTSYNKAMGRYDMYKTFKEANILNNKEEYELEIEFLNNKKHGLSHLIVSEGLKIKNLSESDTTFQPLSPGLNYKESEKEEITFDDLIGEYIIIKDDFLKTLRKEVFKKLSGKKNAYIQEFLVKDGLTYAKLIFNDIEDIADIDVPITMIYNEKWNSEYLSNTSDVLGKITDKTIENVNNNYNKILYELLTVINGTKLLLSQGAKSNILNDYIKLTNASKNKKVFMAPQPVTLNFDNLKLDNSISILFNYAVTEKADGIRYLLYINKEKKGYLINTKLDDVINIGIEFPNIKGEWVLDGEYIQTNKYGEAIQLYMIFDVYWAMGDTNEKHIHKYPFKRLNATIKYSREEMLNLFKTEYLPKLKIIENDFHEFRIYNKVYEFGSIDSITNHDNEIMQKQILLKSKNILEKNKSSAYEYEIDGLIYLPINLPVACDLSTDEKDDISGSWFHNLKWKPEDENTIDFKVNIISESVKTKSGVEYSRDKLFPYISYSDSGEEILNNYKQAIVSVSYNQVDDNTLKYYMLMLTSVYTKSKPLITFNPPNRIDDIEKTNIPLTDNKLICIKDKREIKNGDIIEMRYNPDSENGFKWIPLRVRSDKPKPQYFIYANDNWKTIINPITNNMISGNIKLSNINDYILNEYKNLYYLDITDRKKNVVSQPLKDFHNFVKYSLITGVCGNKSVTIMDTSIGRGGDITKYIQNNVKCKFLFGLDISSINEASKRLYYLNYKKPNVVFIRYNTSKNIKDEDGIYNNEPEFEEEDINHSKIMLNILYGKKESIPREYSKIRSLYHNKCNDKFDIVSSQFSLHYYFKSEETFAGFLSNLNDNCKTGSYFIGTCYDGQRLFDLLKPLDKLEYRDDANNLIYSIDKKYTITNLDDNLFGNEIDVFMESIGRKYTEYLVNFDRFIEIMKENDFVLEAPSIEKEYDIFDGPLNSFESILTKIKTLKTNKILNSKKYINSLKILSNKELYTLSSLNNYFIFKKK